MGQSRVCMYTKALGGRNVQPHLRRFPSAFMRLLSTVLGLQRPRVSFALSKRHELGQSLLCFQRSLLERCVRFDRLCHFLQRCDSTVFVDHRVLALC